MKNIHPDENEIQNYVLETNSNIDVSNHILQCKNCSLKVEQYKQLFAGIQHQETPIFQFNLNKLVMEQLPQPKPKFRVDKYLIHIIISVAAVSCLALLYFLTPLLSNIFLPIKPILMYLITTGAVCISTALSFDMYKKYQKQMNIVNFY